MYQRGARVAAMASWTGLMSVLLGSVIGDPARAASVVQERYRATEEGKAPARPLRVPQAGSEIAVDGALDEPAWDETAVVQLPYEIDPGENTPTRVRTICLLTADAKDLYLGCRAFDPEPAAIRAHYTDRDAADTDDWILFSLDTFADQRCAVEVRVNPLGVQMGGLLNELGGSGAEIDPPWDSSGSAPSARELSYQALFCWELNPQTVCLVGCSSSREGSAGGPMHETGGIQFAKLGYVFRP